MESYIDNYINLKDIEKLKKHFRVEEMNSVLFLFLIKVRASLPFAIEDKKRIL